MSDHSENAMHAAIKALAEVVAPSVDKGNPLAVEQLRLVVTFLEFHVRAMPQSRRLQWMELHLQAELARKVAELLQQQRPALAAPLCHALEQGQAALAQPGAPATTWQQAAARLAAAVCAALDSAATASGALARRLDALVVDESRHMLDLKRVWFRPYGFEARPGALPALEDVLRAGPEV